MKLTSEHIQISKYEGKSCCLTVVGKEMIVIN